MSSRWPLTLALAGIESQIWSTTPFIVFGTIAPADGGLLRFEQRTPAVTAVNTVHPDEFEPDRSVDRLLSSWQAGPMIRVPIQGTDASCFAALPAASESNAAHTQSLERLARQLAARWQAGESDEERERRLLRIDALSDVLRTLTGTLDLRDVFDRLSASARGVLPHDSAFGLLFTRV